MSDSEIRYRVILDSLMEGCQIIDFSYRYIYANDTAARHGHRQREELLGRTMMEIYPGIENTDMFACLRDCMENRWAQRLENLFTFPDGSQSWFELSIEPVPDGVFMLSWDITERKQTEETLGLQAELLDTELDSVYVHNLEGNFVYVNRATCLRHGYSREELLNMKLSQLDAPESEQLIAPRTKEILEKGQATFEVNHLHKNGSIIPLEVHVSLVEHGGKKLIMSVARDITERRRAEEALRQSEAKYRNLVENAPVGISVSTREGRLLEINKTRLAMAGYTSKEEYLSTSIFERLYDLKDREHWLALEQENGRLEGYEMRFKHKDNTTYWCSVSSIPQVSESGEQQFIVVTQDITERKQAENELETKAKLLDAATDAIFLHDGQDHTLYCNRAACRIHGYSEEEIKRLGFSNLIAPSERGFFPKRVNDIRGTGDLTFEAERVRKDGSVFPVEVHAHPIEINGRHLIISTVRDVSKRKKAETELIKLRKAIDTSGEAVMLTDIDGVITYVNPEFTRLYGYSDSEVVGKTTPRILKSGEHAPEMYQAFWQALLNKQVVKGELLNKTQDGDLVNIEGSASAILDDGGNIIGFIAIQRDISERKRTEEERQKMSEQLMVNDRLASIGQLTSGIAHELNNPLTIVIGFSELLLEKDIPDDIKDDLVTITREARRTAGIVKGLLTFARKQKTEKEPMDINDTIKEVMQLRSYEQTVNNIKVNMLLAADLPQIVGNKGQLQQVFINIIVNAEQAMLEALKGGTLTVTTEQSGDTAKVCIADDGPGISPGNMNKLFTPFFTTKDVGKGTGLGLSICHGIVTEHGGKIRAESKPGQGATFIIELPFAR